MSTAESPPALQPAMLVVMGVSGSGKSMVAAQIAGRIDATYIDADDLHPAANIAKMRAGTPLTDEDRWPWLDRVAADLVETAAGGRTVVMACSALRRVYRDRLRSGTRERARFVFLDASYEVIDARLAKRLNHFMPEALLRSQFATLERPAADEADVLTVSAAQAPEAVLNEIVGQLDAFLQSAHSPE